MPVCVPHWLLCGHGVLSTKGNQFAEADSVGCIILLLCDVAELFFPLVIAIHCLLSLVTEGAGLPNSFSWWHLGQIDMRGQSLVDA